MRVTSEYIAYIYFKYYEKDFDDIFTEIQENNHDIDLCDGYLNTKLVRDMKGYLINRTPYYKENKLLEENIIALNFLVSDTIGTKWEDIGRFRIQLVFNVHSLDNKNRRILITFSRNNKGEYYYYISVAKIDSSLVDSDRSIYWKEPLILSDMISEDYNILESILSAENHEIYNFPDDLLPSSN